ncbi:polysaccharide deacetylase family protein [Mycobacterium sp. GA-2829]|uniref:polysaccharide deacetylase family protein n=1 Tax=Mycobacterium sp. GA-2829 TaxID=1772283 RepID=UPI0007400CED|nr:polysaccharide deacetylase family protein [Mycobacterium sp. GA-2829]KUI36679.1 hypothetical protein AU194_22490 [Mycobacterium sp. GA-2829]
MSTDSEYETGAASARAVSVPILMYHSVNEVPRSATRALSVHPAAFAQQLAYLRREGFTGITFGDLCERRREGVPLPSRPIVLTFDDGYADFVEEALPVLCAWGFPATVFVTTGWLRGAGRDPLTAPPDRMLCWTQVAEAAAAGIEIGAHSDNHPELDQISERRLRAELGEPRRILEDRMGQTIRSLAYPYGYSNRHVREVCREVGYLQAAAVANRVSSDHVDAFRVPRLTVRRSTSMSAFARTVRLKRVAVQYAPARTLTAGWAVARRTRSAVRQMRPTTSGSEGE